MASPLSVNKNPYNDNPKSSNIYTPAPVSDFIHDLLADRDYKVVFDPAIGGGSLTDPWRASGRTILGCDIDGNAAANADRPLGKDFTDLRPEDVAQWPCPDLILVNPPFNRSKGRDDLNDKTKADAKPQSNLPPERFLRRIISLFGGAVAIVLFCPMGMTLNQRRRSKRFPWMRDVCPPITSTLSLPLDVFAGVEFHQQVLFFNIPGLPAHQFLPDAVIEAIYQQVVHVDTREQVYWRTDQAGWNAVENYETMTETEALARKFKPFKAKKPKGEYTEEERQLIAAELAAGGLGSSQAISGFVRKLRRQGQAGQSRAGS